jgi:hypothetical protein
MPTTMSYPLCPSSPIEEIDLTGDSDPKVSQIQVPSSPHQNQHQALTPTPQTHPHFDRQLSILNHQQNLKNLTTIWHRNSSGSFCATEQLNPLLYHSQRRQYLNRNGEVDHEWAENTWEQWEQRESHPAVKAFREYNDPPSPEMACLESLKENLRRGDGAVNDMWAELGRANRLLDVAAMPSNDQNLYGLPTATRVILGDVRKSLRSIEKAQRESKKQVELLEPAVKALVSSPPAHPTIPHKAY